MKELMKKALSSETIFKNIFSYFDVFNKYVKTDASINDMARYATVMKNINISDVVTETLPGAPSYMYGISGYSVNESEATTLVYNMFKRPLEEIAAELKATAPADSTVESSADKKIQILNGGYIDGMASEIQERFSEIGVNTANIGTYNGEKKAETQIIVSRDDIGKDLVSCFDKTANIVVDNAQTTAAGYDIIVVVGTDEPKDRASASVYSGTADTADFKLNIMPSGESYTPPAQTYTQNDYTDYDFDDEDEEEYYEEEEIIEETEEEYEDEEPGDVGYDEDDTEDDGYTDEDTDEDVQPEDTDVSADVDNSEVPEADNSADTEENAEDVDNTDEGSYDYYEEEVAEY